MRRIERTRLKNWIKADIVTMSRHIPPYRSTARWLLGCHLWLALAALPLTAFAEVTLNTSVERISSSMPGTAAMAAGVVTDVASSADTPAEVFPGDVLRYTIVFENRSTQDVAAGSVVITNPLPDETVYLEGSAIGKDTQVSYSVDGATFAAPEELLVGEGAQARAATAGDYRVIRWTYEPMLPAGASSQVSFELLIP